MIYIVTASCYNHKVFVEAESVEEAKIKGIECLKKHNLDNGIYVTYKEESVSVKPLELNKVEVGHDSNSIADDDSRKTIHEVIAEIVYQDIYCGKASLIHSVLVESVNEIEAIPNGTVLMDIFVTYDSGVSSNKELSKNYYFKYTDHSTFKLENTVYSIFCFQKSTPDKFLTFCIDHYNGTEEKKVLVSAAKSFWDLVSKIPELDSDIKNVYYGKFDVKAISENDIDQFVFKCFYSFPCINLDILLPKLVKVECVYPPIVNNFNDFKLNVIHVDIIDFCEM
jgi:hypothetical protein